MPEVKEKDQIQTQHAVSNSASTNKKKAQGLTFRRLFTKPGVSPYNEVEWELRLAQITDSQGGMIFEQKDVEVPKDWSMTATNIVASKYLHGQVGTEERETGVRQLVARVAETIRDWGMKDGYFRTSRRRRHLPRRTRSSADPPARGLQFPRLVQRRLRSHRTQIRSHQLALEFHQQPSRVRSHRIHAPAMLRLLHQLHQRFAGLDPDVSQDRRHALQVGQRHRHKSLPAASAPPKFSAVEAQPAAR